METSEGSPASGSQRIARRIETAANIAVILVACAMGTSLILKYALPAAARGGISKGTRLTGESFNWSRKPRTLVFALSTTCHFCTESGSFYQLLLKKSPRETTRTLALFPQSPAESESYLAKLGVSVDEIKQVPLESLRVAGTPTVFIVNREGVVESVWEGKLRSSGENEILAAITEPLR
jgi:hypothetical protein